MSTKFIDQLKKVFWRNSNDKFASFTALFGKILGNADLNKKI